jgi:DnaK suppressor protein
MMKTPEDVRRDLSWMREQLTERLRQLEQSARAMIGEYQHAIERIDRGCYGICERCELPIEVDRLEALPQATQCKECAAKRRPN